MKKHFNKKLIVITAVALLLLISIGTTLAFLVAQTDPVVNSFQPSRVTCAVVEDGGTAVNGSLVNTGDTKKNVQIKNTGDTDAYIRAAVVVNWMSTDGTKVWAQKPVANTDYTIEYNLDANGWFDGGDGFYYYSSSVPPTELTAVLITSAKQIVNAPEGYYLSIEIVGSAIQSMPTSTVAAEWGVTVNGDGNITNKTSSSN